MARLNFPSRGISTNGAWQWCDICPPRVISLKYDDGLAIQLDNNSALTRNNMRRIEPELQIILSDTNLIELSAD
ncbi:MAG TPA: hypothetical protein VGO57_09205 [Verrucomicrobiae bacterium]